MWTQNRHHSLISSQITILLTPLPILFKSFFLPSHSFNNQQNLQNRFRFGANFRPFTVTHNLSTKCKVGVRLKSHKTPRKKPFFLGLFQDRIPFSTIMSAALIWLVSPNSEVCNGLGLLDTTTRLLEKGFLRSDNRRIKNVGNKCYSCFSESGFLGGNGRRNDVVSRRRRVVANPSGGLTAAVSSEQLVYDVVLKQAALVKEQMRSREEDMEVKPDIVLPGTLGLLNEAYDRCGEVCAEYAKTFYLGTLLMTPERRKAIWAIYVWCRRTDELVDGPNASHITPKALDRWESRLEDLFNGRPFDMLDAALSDTVSKFPVDIQPFKDMIDGMRMDLKKSRYENFDQLYLYCYYVAGTVGLMSVPIMGIAHESQAPTESVYNAALALGIANQLTNILRDVGEDARRGRVYLPQDELAQAGLSDDDIFAMKVTNKWRVFMKKQIKRARTFFDQAEEGVTQLSSASRWPVWASLLLYRQILDEIEANDYNNFTRRAYVSKPKKIVALPVAYAKSLVSPSSRKLGSNEHDHVKRG